MANAKIRRFCSVAVRTHEYAFVIRFNGKDGDRVRGDFEVLEGKDQGR